MRRDEQNTARGADVNQVEKDTHETMVHARVTMNAACILGDIAPFVHLGQLCYSSGARAFHRWNVTPGLSTRCHHFGRIHEL